MLCVRPHAAPPFRPDFLPQIAEFCFTKILSRYVDFDAVSSSLERHCESDWQRRPSVLLHEQVPNKVCETLELLHFFANPGMAILRLSLGSVSIKTSIDAISKFLQADYLVVTCCVYYASTQVKQREKEDGCYLRR